MRCKATPTERRGRGAGRAPSPCTNSESIGPRVRPGERPAGRAGILPRRAATGLRHKQSARAGTASPPAVRFGATDRPTIRRRRGRRAPLAAGKTTLARTATCATRGCSGVVRRSRWLVLVPAALPATPPRELPEKLRTSCQRLRSSSSSRSRDREAGIQFHKAYYAAGAGVRSIKKEKRRASRPFLARGGEKSVRARLLATLCKES